MFFKALVHHRDSTKLQLCALVAHNAMQMSLHQPPIVHPCQSRGEHYGIYDTGDGSWLLTRFQVFIIVRIYITVQLQLIHYGPWFQRRRKWYLARTGDRPGTLLQSCRLIVLDWVKYTIILLLNEFPE